MIDYFQILLATLLIRGNAKSDAISLKINYKKYIEAVKLFLQYKKFIVIFLMPNFLLYCLFWSQNITNKNLGQSKTTLLKIKIIPIMLHSY